MTFALDAPREVGIAMASTPTGRELCMSLHCIPASLHSSAAADCSGPAALAASGASPHVDHDAAMLQGFSVPVMIESCVILCHALSSIT